MVKEACFGWVMPPSMTLTGLVIMEMSNRFLATPIAYFDSVIKISYVGQERKGFCIKCIQYGPLMLLVANGCRNVYRPIELFRSVHCTIIECTSYVLLKYFHAPFFWF